MNSKSKKKQIDFSVRPRANKKELPATADEWVQDANEQPKPVKQEEGPQKRLTLNLPTKLHTAFKARCVMRDVTIQDRVQLLIERDLADYPGAPKDKPEPD
jgi:ParG